MSKKIKSIIKTAACLIMLELVFFAVGYFYLNHELKKTATDRPLSSVPYYTQVPQRCEVLLNVCQDEILLDLNFGDEILGIIFLEADAESYGYTVDYTLKLDYETVGYLVDAAGGIELESMRYTGVQITEMLEYRPHNEDFKRSVLSGIIKGFSTNGFAKEDLLYLIENCETDLSFAVCFDWVKHIPTLCKFPRFVN